VHDYIEAMRVMLSVGQPEDLVIATGRLTTVREFLTIAARCVDFQPEFSGSGQNEICVDAKTGVRIAQVNSKYFRKHGTPPLVGDSSRITALTDWRPSRSLNDIVFEMIEADCTRLKQGITNV
jgi:GDPmannose 4,6-dehydratase